MDIAKLPTLPKYPECPQFYFGQRKIIYNRVSCDNREGQVNLRDFCIQKRYDFEKYSQYFYR
jgi:hypothetical protein